MTNIPESEFNAMQTKIMHLEQAKKFHEQLLTYFSFEMRTSATMIKGYSTLLLDHPEEFGQLNNKQTKSIETMQKSAERIFKVQDEFRSLGIVAQASKGNPEKVNFSQFIDEVEEIKIGTLIAKRCPDIWVDKHWLSHLMKLVFSLPSYITPKNRTTTLDSASNEDVSTIQIVTELRVCSLTTLDIGYNSRQ